MLVRCKDGCKNNTMTDASLDVDADEVICNTCGETISHVTAFAKNAMKGSGDIIKKAKGKAFQFSCLTCKKVVATTCQNDEIVGVNCEQTDKCKFNISNYMKHAVKLFAINESFEEKEE